MTVPVAVYGVVTPGVAAAKKDYVVPAEAEAEHAEMLTDGLREDVVEMESEPQPSRHIGEKGKYSDVAAGVIGLESELASGPSM